MIFSKVHAKKISFLLSGNQRFIILGIYSEKIYFSHIFYSVDQKTCQSYNVKSSFGFDSIFHAFNSLTSKVHA